MISKLHKYSITLLSFILLLSVARSSSGSAFASEASLHAEPFQSQQVNFNPDLYETDLINVIFQDGSRIRLRDGNLVDLEGANLSSGRARSALSADSGGSITPTFPSGEEEIDRQREQAEALSGEALPDLNNSYRIKLPAGLSVEVAIALFNQMDEVYGAFPAPKPVAPPAPPYYEPPLGENFDALVNRNVYQRYLCPTPAGFDFRFAAEGLGGKGKEVKICDVEYGYNTDHPDLPVIVLTGLPPDPALPSS